MADEIRLAFAHPSERAIATEGEAPRDRISLRGHVVEVEIGAFQAERGHTQRVRFDVVVEVVPAGGPLDDDVDRILSYDRVTEAISTELAAERVNLLETLAERIAERILLEPQAMRAFVRIEKLDRGPGALGVEIVRTRRDFGNHLQEVAQVRPHPRVIYLSNEAIASDALTGWLDAAEAEGAPLILCVGLPEGPRPQADHPLAQRRIDLLAIEQNGWVLAARDPRAKVVATRTELDWAMKNGQVCIWAPSKIVLDATQGPQGRLRDSVALAGWFAGLMEACELVVIGETPPADASVPLRSVTVGNT
ncbi:dihydroneopterin aldolase [Salipiger mucosus]|uniref:dihydroneopterin aldolase n=1 Tax=Salipiger mucosus DSM 16094 TaxID=1123237 RepID=S9QG40_9RHOB|nr:dihydroneopterin aldolase [Salipiger mucosus]EPX78837.1 Dihydroneopterin aldolase / delta 1-pyrroline-5-carboxylate synthetase [Salipiger mucosus DSM 16094]